MLMPSKFIPPASHNLKITKKATPKEKLKKENPFRNQN
jgi:hypothetical protein